MRSPAFGTAWMLWRKHRIGLLSFYGFLMFQAVLSLTLSRELLNREGIIVANVLPLVGSLAFLVGVFALSEGDIAGRESCYPAYLFLLPVRAWELALWPLVMGAVTLASTWVLMAEILFVSRGMIAPVLWPAAMMASLLGILQALSWTPFGLPYARVVLALALLPAWIGEGTYLHQNGTPPWALALGYLTVMPLAYAASVRGIAHARRGDTPRWGWGRAGSVADRGESRGGGEPFASPERAQFWLERRRYGWRLPLAVAVPCLLLTPFMALHADLTSLPRWLFPGMDAVRVSTVGFNMLALPAMAAVLFAQVLGSGLHGSDHRRKDLSVNPFLAVRPVSTAALIGAKLKLAAWTTGVTWAILLACETFWLAILPAHEGPVDTTLGALILRYATVNGTLAGGLLLAVLILLTWRNQVQGLAADYSGRSWIVNGYAFAFMFAFFCYSYGAALFLDGPGRLAGFVRLLPALAGVAVAVKLLMSAGAALALRRQRLLTDATLSKALGAWMLAALGLIAGVWWIFPAGQVSLKYLGLGAALFLPLARLLMAPLSLAWNRHR